MTTTDNNQVTLTEFLSAFFPDNNEKIEFRSFGAKGSKGIVPKTYSTTRNNLALSPPTINNEKSGVYFVVNSGGNKDEDITRYTAFFAENDELPMKEQHEALDNAPLQPSIRVETKKSIHAYWLIDGECSEDEWRDVQARLIAYFNCDPSNKNPSRCMRLPFFNHVSFNKVTSEYGYKQVEIAKFNRERRFTVEEMKEAFPLPAAKTKPQTKRNRKTMTSVTGVTRDYNLKGYETWGELNSELAMRIMQQGTINSSGKYEMRCPVHQGESETVLFFDPETKAVKCMSEECTYKEILVAFDLPEAPTADEKEQRQSQATLLVNMAKDIELFTSQDNEPYATISVNGHKETWALESSNFREWLGREFYVTYGNVVGEYGLKDALASLAGKAKYEGQKHQVSVRRAEYNGDLYLDLCNDNWEVVRITRNGWTVTSDCPVKFRRTAAMMPIPTPSEGNLDELDKFLNIHGNDLILAKVWLMTTLQTGIPYPILVFSSQQKSGKSTSAKVLSDLFDPNIAALVGKPKSEEDLFISVSNRLVVAFDNVSFIDENFSDALCRIATGGSYVKRKLHTDKSETILKAKNPILLNGIGDLTTRGDLLDRSIVINLPTLQYKADEGKFWTEFEEAKPRILGALLDGVCEVLKNFDNVNLTGCDIRMMDFAKVGVAVEQFLGLTEGTFVEICNENYKISNKIAFENNPVANVIIELVNERGKLEGTATELFSMAYTKADEPTRRNRAFPNGAQGFSNCLVRLSPNLLVEGIIIDKYRAPGTGARMISIKRNGLSQSSHLSHNDDEEQLELW